MKKLRHGGNASVAECARRDGRHRANASTWTTLFIAEVTARATRVDYSRRLHRTSVVPSASSAGAPHVSTVSNVGRRARALIARTSDESDVSLVTHLCRRDIAAKNDIFTRRRHCRRDGSAHRLRRVDRRSATETVAVGHGRRKLQGQDEKVRGLERDRFKPNDGLQRSKRSATKNHS